MTLAVAAGNGRIRTVAPVAEFEAQQLVAAGLTLLQRSATVVRALNGRRAAILLPPSPAFITALAASEGRGAVLIDPRATSEDIAFQCADAGVGAVFTESSLFRGVPEGMPAVLLDDAPRIARVVSAGLVKEVDLGSHHGLSIDGELGVAGSDEEAVVIYDRADHVSRATIMTHADLLADSRAANLALGNSADDHVLALRPWTYPFELIVTACAPLLAGARVTTLAAFHPAEAAGVLADGVTQIAGDASLYRDLLDAVSSRELDLRNNDLRVCICRNRDISRELRERWLDATGVELHQYHGPGEGINSLR
ncbi:MAG: hypothetical protein V4550_03030 [Gemmatimonadota bacterium]